MFVPKSTSLSVVGLSTPSANIIWLVAVLLTPIKNVSTSSSFPAESSIILTYFVEGDPLRAIVPLSKI